MVDKYTRDTKKWLEERFKMVDGNGIYFAHQPIYGMRGGNSEPGLVERYLRTYKILQALAHLRFKTFLDVGGAEGYKAAIVKKIFKIKVQNSDLSREACKRAEEIYKIPSTPVDIHKLPFKNNQFEVLLCSETLEHVTDFKKALNELLRVASKAVVITLPHENEKKTRENKKNKIPHAHIHHFDGNSFDYLLDKGFLVKAEKFFTDLIWIPSLFIDTDPVDTKVKNGAKKLFFEIYNFLRPLFKKLFKEGSMEFVINLDSLLDKLKPSYNAVLFLILKDNTSYSEKPRRKISLREILNFKVKYHYLKNG